MNDITKAMQEITNREGWGPIQEHYEDPAAFSIEFTLPADAVVTSATATDNGLELRYQRATLN